MPRVRVSMYKITEILRLRHEEGRTQREISRNCGLAQSTVHRVLRRTREAGLSWPLPEGLDEERLQGRLYGQRKKVRGKVEGARPDFRANHKDLKKHRRLTLRLVWKEYREQQPEGYGYSRFCELYRSWRRRQHVVIRQRHRAGEKLFVKCAVARYALLKCLRLRGHLKRAS